MSTIPAATLAALAVALGTGGLAVAGVVGFVVAVVVQMARPRLWREVAEERRMRLPDLPEEAELLDEDARRGLQRLRQCRSEREEAELRLGAAGKAARDARLRACLAELERASVALIRGLDRIGRGLAGQSRWALERATDQVARALAVTPGTAAAELETLAEMNRCGLERRARLEEEKYGLTARLATLVGALEQVPVWLLQQEAREQAERARAHQDALDTLAALMALDQTGESSHGGLRRANAANGERSEEPGQCRGETGSGKPIFEEAEARGGTHVDCVQ